MVRGGTYRLWNFKGVGGWGKGAKQVYRKGGPIQLHWGAVGGPGMLVPFNPGPDFLAGLLATTWIKGVDKWTFSREARRNARGGSPFSRKDFEPDPVPCDLMFPSGWREGDRGEQNHPQFEGPPSSLDPLILRDQPGNLLKPIAFHQPL